MPAKCRGQLSLKVVRSSHATNPRWVGGVSRIVKVFTPRGQHIGTYHEIVLPDGSVPHSHPKDTPDVIVRGSQAES